MIQEENSTSDSLKFSIPLECPKNNAICYALEENSSLMEINSEEQGIPHTPEQSGNPDQHCSSPGKGNRDN
jgi:hypothetical protein